MEYFLLWIVIGIIGALIGNLKGETTSGFVLGLLLGPIGWIIIAVSKGNRAQ